MIGIGAGFQQHANDLRMPTLRCSDQWTLPVFVPCQIGIRPSLQQVFNGSKMTKTGSPCQSRLPDPVEIITPRSFAQQTERSPTAKGTGADHGDV